MQFSVSHSIISVMIPQESWVSKWQRIGTYEIYVLHYCSCVSLSLLPTLDRYVPGCYAMSVSGDLPQDVTDSLQDKGVPYISRDTSNRN